MLDSTVISVIGAGQMGEAIISGLIKQELVKPAALHASAPRPERGSELVQKYGITCHLDNASAAKHGDIVIICVKPQKLSHVLHPLKGNLKPGALVLSIVAGATMAGIQESLGHPLLARAMPNTPAQISQGITAWTCADSLDETNRNKIRAVLSALGSEVYVDGEQYIDMATALSGTGPAYIFLFMEAMTDAGVHLGFSRRVAEELVQKTMLGSTLYAMQSKMHPAQLRNAVTSPGGTTAEALSELERGGLRTVLSDAVWAAFNRAKELGKS